MNRKNKVRTAYIFINPGKCAACWECVAACPKQVIGKVQILWHKHIVLKNAENCSGCQKCIKICPHGVFNQQ